MKAQPILLSKKDNYEHWKAGLAALILPMIPHHPGSGTLEEIHKKFNPAEHGCPEFVDVIRAVNFLISNGFVEQPKENESAIQKWIKLSLTPLGTFQLCLMPEVIVQLVD